MPSVTLCRLKGPIDFIYGGPRTAAIRGHNTPELLLTNEWHCVRVTNQFHNAVINHFDPFFVCVNTNGVKLSEVSAPNDFHNVSNRERNVLCLWVAPIFAGVTSFIFGICPGM